MEKIAIIGIASILPGANNKEKYWENLLNKRDAKSYATIKNMGVDPLDYYNPKKGQTDRYYCVKGGFIKGLNVDFGKDEEKLKELDDIFKWSFYTAKEALRDAGYLNNKKELKNCGVILANLSFPTKSSNHLFLPMYQKIVEFYLSKNLKTKFKLPYFIDSEKKVNYENKMISGYPSLFISENLNLGPIAFSLDAACSSSIYSVKLAADYLIKKKAKIMLAGAVSAGDPFFINMGFSVFQAYPENNLSFPLDKNSKGLIAGEGAAFFVMKRLEDAIQDKDNIYAVINSIGLSNDGGGASFLSPNKKGQIKALKRAYQKATVSHKKIQYIECHATGTKVGDKQEINSIASFFKENNLHLGSVKSNLGHLLTVSGMASMIKVILSMKHSIIPPSINIKEPQESDNKLIKANQIVLEPILWKEKNKYAAINGFGFGGTNGHIILEKKENYKSYKRSNIESKKKDIYITGMNVFCSKAENLNEFYKLVKGEKIEEKQKFPDKRWGGIERDEDLLKALGIKNKNGYFIEKFDFDFMHFKIPPDKDDRITVQQLLMLKVADMALRDASVKQGENVAVIIAMSSDLTLHRFRGRVNLETQLKETNIKNQNAINSLKRAIQPPARTNQYTSYIGNIMASRISSLWDFSGPSFTVSSEELSFFNALDVAKNLIESKEADKVLIGAVEIAGFFENFYIEKDKGLKIGEGAGAIVITSDKKEKPYAKIEDIILSKKYQKRECETARDLTGHIFAANGIFDIIKATFLYDKKEVWIGGKFNNIYSYVNIVPIQKEIKEIKLKEKLVKTVYLGGENISQNILKALTFINQEEKKEPETFFKQNTSKLYDIRNSILGKLSKLDVKKDVIWDKKDLLEFAEGKIANVFGKEYAIIDSYKKRVRLPLKDYFFVSRVTKLSAKTNQFKPSSITTEYDIPEDADYLIDGQIPWAVAVEAGQCDLLLISYLGIDFQNKGEKVYRLLDCTLTFKDKIAMQGDTLRYDIKIDSFAKNGETLLFFFSYDCFVKNQLVLTMRDGCAGFFSEEELSKGKGLIFSQKELEEKREIEKKTFDPILKCTKKYFSKKDIINLTKGFTSLCFGKEYETEGNKSLKFSSEKMLMIDEVVKIDTKGGSYGLGFATARKNLKPTDWYFPCHFKDDEVLAGSLMSEACVQLLQFFMLYIGLQTKTKDARFQPIFNLSQKVRCRGQVTPKDKLLYYEMEVKEIGTKENPYAVADINVIVDNKIVVNFQNLGIQLIEKKDVPLFSKTHLKEFATGDLKKCFGEEFKIYDNRKGPRTPNSYLQLIDRIVSIEGEKNNFKQEATLVSEFDIKKDGWFLKSFKNKKYVPYSILMEIALQPCGFLATYLGTTLLAPDTDLFFRNIDGNSKMLYMPDLVGKTITTRVKLLSTYKSGTTILQKFDFELFESGKKFYTGDTLFGFFPENALLDQKGLSGSLKKCSNLKTLKSESGMLNLLDKMVIKENEGKYKKGYIYGEKKISRKLRFFDCHFFQDPVMPGSLGIESILEAITHFCKKSKKELLPIFKTNVWKYRGQIAPDTKLMTIEVDIKEMDSEKIVVDASLWKDKIKVYEIEGFLGF